MDSAIQKVQSIPKTSLLNDGNQQIKKKIKKKLKPTQTKDNLISRINKPKPVENFGKIIFKSTNIYYLLFFSYDSYTTINHSTIGIID